MVEGVDQGLVLEVDEERLRDHLSHSNAHARRYREHEENQRCLTPPEGPRGEPLANETEFERAEVLVSPTRESL